MPSRRVHLVGSIPLSDAREVFVRTTDVLNDVVKRIPDGETGTRLGWMRWKEEIAIQHPDLEPATSVSKTHATGFTFQNYRVRSGLAPEKLRFGSLGYAEHAKLSYQDFSKLKLAGAIGKDIRFLVCIPTPIAFIWSYIAPEHQTAVEPAYTARTIEEVKEIADAIPPDQLAIQWDMPHEIIILEGARTIHLDSSRDALLHRLAMLGESVPTASHLGYHFCYGDSGHKHAIEPRDTGLMVGVANDLTRRLSRDINFFHMPVPRQRDDEEFFQPLTKLVLRSSTELYLGLVHITDGEEGGRRRIAAAAKFYPDFGIATECGMGRRPAGMVQDILELHRALA